ncbi:MucR family transcriptional regulator [Brytella acorum]|uniref:MucR family transcriptional regulator n=1 Tax=Brytella acorum TaxID=2959299 RepID=A0AA35UK47_9PROT|nr:MucR family transcriptional regulator [Brytella acorum]CAI9121865.1 MucR family transcriptional regulator [Brytella acorum]
MSDENNNTLNNAEVARLTVQLTSAYASRNAINSPDDLFNLMSGIKDKIANISAITTTTPQISGKITDVEESPALALPAPTKPAVDPEKSVFEDHIICLEDGKSVKMLKRYIMTNYGLTPDAYRRRWNLPASYPMVSPAISKARAETARKSDLGHSRQKKAEETEA